MFKFEEIMFRNSGMDATQLAQAKLDRCSRPSAWRYPRRS